MNLREAEQLQANTKVVFVFGKSKRLGVFVGYTGFKDAVKVVCGRDEYILRSDEIETMDSVEAAEHVNREAARRRILVRWWNDRRREIRAYLGGKRSVDWIPLCAFQNIIKAAERRGVLVNTEQEIK